MSSKEKGVRWPVTPSEAGLRLDKFLAGADRLASRGRVARVVTSGKVFLNEREVGAADLGARLAAGDVVRVWMDRPGSAKAFAAKKRIGSVRILYEDASLIVLDKPAGLLTVPLERKHEADSVFDHIERHLRSHGKRRPLVVHRIDRDTSGLVVFAKDAAAQQRLKDQFRRREPERVYLAVVYGHPSPTKGVWRDRLVWDQRSLIQKETHPNDPRGVDAVSEYRTVESFRDAALLEIKLKTGKRNQIRIQARLRGHTLVGERRYTYGPDALRPRVFERQALHAHRLAFRHPVDGRALSFEAPVPSDMAALVEGLRGENGSAC